MKILTTAEPGSAPWHAARAGKIGSTAAVNILLGADLNHRTFSSPLGEFMRLTGRAEKDANPNDDPELAAILRWGNVSESLHRALLAEETGGIFEGPPGVVQHDALDWLAVSPDGYATLDDHGRGSLELKAPTQFTAHDWDSDAPLPYQVQGAAIMAVEQTPFCIVSALIPPRPRWYVVMRDLVFEQYLLDTLGAFWEQHVLRDIPPPATFRPIDKALLYRLHPKDNGATAILPPEFELEFASLRDESAQLDALEKAVAGRKARISQAIGPNSFGAVGPYSASFKHQARTVSCKSCGAITSHSEFRVLRPKFA